MIDSFYIVTAVYRCVSGFDLDAGRRARTLGHVVGCFAFSEFHGAGGENDSIGWNITVLAFRQLIHVLEYGCAPDRNGTRHDVAAAAGFAGR